MCCGLSLSQYLVIVILEQFKQRREAKLKAQREAELNWREDLRLMLWLNNNFLVLLFILLATPRLRMHSRRTSRQSRRRNALILLSMATRCFALGKQRLFLKMRLCVWLLVVAMVSLVWMEGCLRWKYDYESIISLSAAKPLCCAILLDTRFLDFLITLKLALNSINYEF